MGGKMGPPAGPVAEEKLSASSGPLEVVIFDFSGPRFESRHTTVHPRLGTIIGIGRAFLSTALIEVAARPFVWSSSQSRLTGRCKTLVCDGRLWLAPD